MEVLIGTILLRIVIVTISPLNPTSRFHFIIHYIYILFTAKTFDIWYATGSG